MKCVASHLLLLLSTSSLAFGQGEVGCFISGECTGGHLEGVNNGIATPENCLTICQLNTNCKVFTHYSIKQECILYASCPLFNDQICNGCVSGDVTCSPDDQCYFTGQCNGRLIAAETGKSLEQCRADCGTSEDCRYFTFNSDNGVCLLFEDCPTTDQSCTTCVSGPKSCEGEQGYTKVMVVGGYTSDYLTDVETIDFATTTSNCRKPADFPAATSDMVATLLDGESIWVCGGGDASGTTKDCFTYNAQDNTWTVAPSTMLEERVYAMSTQLEDHKWWITGGSGLGGASLSTTEVMKDGVFSQGPPLIEPMYEHCLVKINNTHYFFSGGYGSNRAYIYNYPEDNWMEMPALPKIRYGHVCQLINTDTYGLEVVVAGGWLEKTTMVFSLDSLTWSQGPDLPTLLYSPSSVTSGREMVVMGGFISSAISKDIIALDRTTGTWNKLDQELSTARNHATVAAMTDEMANC